ncbi:MAG: PQQ-binding-like beta-propeller repeat protein [Actinobacteria bacterium]|nr:PQQ-binding-like beta-propeller repeat protein [Actinomycetota bacterium]
MLSGLGRLRSALSLLVHPRRLWREHRRVAPALIGFAVLAIAGAVVGYEVLKRPADVHNETAIRHFKPEKPKEAPKPTHGERPRTVNWPMYGLNPQRTRYLPARGVKPPFRKLWRYTNRPLLEFPPIFVGGVLYAVNNSGYAFALDARTGATIWERRIGRLNASSPAYYKHRLYIVNLVPGHIVKLNAENGKVIWKRSLPNRAESSPLVIDNSVYFGCEDGRLYSVSTVNGNVRWSTQLSGPVKAAPAYYGGRLFVGDYGGSMNAVDAQSGKLVWSTGSLGTGISGGQFYSTPAVAFGRVYAGNNDDRVYSFDLDTGELAWTYSTGGYAYSSPTVASTKHSLPTVYIGSFDGNIYALDAKNGEVRWSRSAGGQVVGSLSAIGEIVYVAEFTNQTTTGYMMRSGRKVLSYPKGTYTPIISDGQNLYVTGYSSITKLAPIRPQPARVSNNLVAPKPRFPSRRLGKSIGNAFVAPAVKRLDLTPRQRRRLRQMAPARRRAAIRVLRRRAAAEAGAAHRAQRRGTARREGGR